MSYQTIYSDTQLAEMWCRLNAGVHPTHDGWGFDPANIAGAMALIITLIGPSKCLSLWRKQSLTQIQNPGGIERRKKPR